MHSVFADPVQYGLSGQLFVDGVLPFDADGSGCQSITNTQSGPSTALCVHLNILVKFFLEVDTALASEYSF